MIIICLIVLVTGVYGICKKVNDKDEYIQQLEQSLQEQIEEKEE